MTAIKYQKVLRYARGMAIRCMSKKSRADGDSSRFQLPPPTWSLKDLGLYTSGGGSTDGTATVVSRDHLRILAKRAVIDIDQLQDDQVETLRRDVENMLHMMQVVENIPLPELSDEDIYDLPRGVTQMPLRRDHDQAAAASEENLREVEEQDAQEVWQSLLQTRTVKLGAHSYFRIVTKHPVQ